MDTFIYFAYGSNMLVERLRLRVRCPSAELIGRANAHGYEMSFKKKSKRGGKETGKATLARGDSPSDKTPGVLFQVSKSELGQLDRAEGKDKGYYRDDWFPVISARSGNILTVTYIAENLVEGLSPYDWYLALVVAGAMQHKLPKKHIDYLKAILATQDTKMELTDGDEALKILKDAGYESVYQEIRLRATEVKPPCT